MVKHRLDSLCFDLQIEFSDRNLLKAAFTHSSYKNEHRNDITPDNERLEFLGDAVLSLCVSRYLYTHYPHAPEGEMTRMRAAVVCESSLADLAKQLGFSNYLRLGKGEEQTGGRERASLLADAFEAFVGGLFLDQGLFGAERFLAEHLFPAFDRMEGSSRKDFKTVLQEYVQHRNLGDLLYDTVEEKGPAHERQFRVRVQIAGVAVAEGVGRSKKEAEQQAAEAALHGFEERR